MLPIASLIAVTYRGTAGIKPVMGHNTRSYDDFCHAPQYRIRYNRVASPSPSHDEARCVAGGAGIQADGRHLILISAQRQGAFFRLRSKLPAAFSVNLLASSM